MLQSQAVSTPYQRARLSHYDATFCTGIGMRRRDFFGVVGGSMTWPLAARAQQTPKVPIIGFLHPGSFEAGSPSYDALRDGLRDAGYIEGQSVKLEARWANGNPALLPQLARDLVQLRAALIVATARPSIEATRAATTEIPIVANDLESDPIASGFVASLSRPGSNLTGQFLDAPTLCGKWLQQVAEIVPGVKRIGILWDATTGTYQLDAIKGAAQSASIDLVVMEFRDSAGLEVALSRGLKENHLQAVIQLGSPLIRQAGPKVAQTLSDHRIPGISQFRTFPDGGGLMSYGPDLIDLYRRVGSYVSKILHGTRPSDLPVERPTKFELVINLKAAKALGLKLEESFLRLADEVIE
jgi:putative ABC transport system substrate-binding protein